MGKRVIVCGGRHFTDRDGAFEVLDAFHRSPEGPIDTVIHGKHPKGADKFAGDWAKSRNVPVAEYPVMPDDWQRFGKAAGPRRNKKMVDRGRPDLVIAFKGNRGTKSMIRIAKEAGIPVQKHLWNPPAFNGLDPKTNALVSESGRARPGASTLCAT